MGQLNCLIASLPHCLIASLPHCLIASLGAKRTRGVHRRCSTRGDNGGERGGDDERDGGEADGDRIARIDVVELCGERAGSARRCGADSSHQVPRFGV